MPYTRTKYLNFETFVHRSASASLVVKLMMACNDLSLANQALDWWKTQPPPDRKEAVVGARMYFVRVQLGHLYEAMLVVREIQQSAELLGLLHRCDPQAQQSFAELEKHLPGGPKHTEFTRLIGLVRHNLSFHYNQAGTLIERAIEDRAGRPEAKVSSVTRGDTAYRWRFNVADDLVDSIVVRQIWRVPREVDLRQEVDKVADRVHQIFLHFMDFSGEFIWKYCEQ